MENSNIINLVKENALYIPAQEASKRSALFTRPFSKSRSNVYDVIEQVPKHYNATDPRTLSCYELVKGISMSTFVELISPDDPDISHLVLTPKQILFTTRHRRSLGNDIVMQCEERQPKLHKFLMLDNNGAVGFVSIFFLDAWYRLSNKTITPYLFFPDKKGRGKDTLQISPGLIYI